MVLFVNGYRFGGVSEEPNSDDGVCETDRYHYWEGLDAQFYRRLNSGTVFYADGHHSIGTSNHKDMLSFYNSARSCIDTFPKNLKELAIKHGQDLSKFWISPALSYLIEREINDPSYIDGKLNKTSNVYGFNLRRRNGQRAAQKLLSAIKKIHASKHLTIEKLDIVAHSMGYAYALGMVDILKGKVPLGRFYIIAPENAEAGEINLNDFEEVWQYGSNLGEPNADPLHQQDGVAPQTPVKGLQELGKKNPEKGGRAFIPEGEPKGFLQSHSIGNYKWIFRRDIKDEGYVKPRK